MIKTNFHTHSTFCDGKNTPEENVLAAIEKNIEILGFSSHSFYPFDFEENIRIDAVPSYCKEIRELQKKYESKLKIRLGFEADYVAGISFPDFDAYKEFSPDYLIGSVHFVFHKDGIIPVDNTPALLNDALKKYYAGKEKQFVCEYFETEIEMVRKCDFSFIGHPDLVRKFNPKLNFFDDSESWYKDAVKSLAKEIARAGIAAEINTGGINRGHLTSPYPTDYFLSLLKEYGVPVLISSDAHSASQLDGSFDIAIEAAKKAGYTEIICDIENGHEFKFTKLE